MLQNVAAMTENQNDLLYFDGSNWNRLAIGTSGYVLKSQGASSPPSWQVDNVDDADANAANEIQNIIASKGLQRDGSNNFGLINCASDNYVLKWSQAGSSWSCAV